MKREKYKFSRDFTCSKYKGSIGKAIEQETIYTKEVKMVRKLMYLCKDGSAHGACDCENREGEV